MEVELQPAALVDVIEARIFNRETGELIAGEGLPFGWRVTAQNRLQIYGLGRPLPPKLDLWFRAHSYRPDDVAVVIAPTPGATCQVPGGEMTFEDIRAGSWSFDGVKLVGPAQSEDRSLTAILALTGDDYQIAAVLKNSERVHTENFTSSSQNAATPALAVENPACLFKGSPGFTPADDREARHS